MTDCLRRVVKLGGSLLDWPELISRLRAWLAAQPPAENLLVIGGGKLADAIREADRIHHVGDEVSHWLCIRAMAMHAEMIAALLPEATTITSLRSLRSLEPRPRLLIVDPWPVLRYEDPTVMGDQALPASWDVTSDSIAARFAALAEASQLVLLKSQLPSGATISDAMSAGYVDGFFDCACRGLENIHFASLRAAGFPAVTIR